MTKLYGGPFVPAEAAHRAESATSRPDVVAVEGAPALEAAGTSPSAPDPQPVGGGEHDIASDVSNRAWRRLAIRRGDRLEVPVIAGRTATGSRKGVETYRLVHEGRVASLRTAGRAP